VGLRVHIDQQRPLVSFSERTCEIYGNRCLATPTLLINNRYGSHSFSPALKNPTLFYNALFNTEKQQDIPYYFRQERKKNFIFL